MNMELWWGLETKLRWTGWNSMISGAVSSLLLLSAFALGAMPPVPRGIGIGETFTESGCCVVDEVAACGAQAGCVTSCSPCAIDESSPGELSLDGDVPSAPIPDCQRCVCCLCGIGLVTPSPEIPHVEIVTLASPEVEDAWFSIARPPTSPPPKSFPSLSFIPLV